MNTRPEIALDFFAGSTHYLPARPLRPAARRLLGGGWALAARLRARALDLSLPPVPWAPEPEDFASTVRGVFAKLDHVERLRADTETRAKLYDTLAKWGAISPNEMRDAENIPRLEDEAADRTFIQSGFTTIANAAQANPANAPTTPAPTATSPTMRPTLRVENRMSTRA